MSVTSPTSIPFVTQLRARPGTITLGDPAAPDVLHLRVEMPTLLDTVRIDAPATEPVRALKVHALDALSPGALFQDDYVIKLRGHEMTDETQSLQSAGATDGSIFLLAYRRRKPVR